MRKRDDEVIKAIAKNIRQIRLELAMTQAEFGELIEVSEQYISQLERAVHAPSIPVISAIATKAKVSIDRIFGLSDAPPKQVDPELAKLVLTIERLSVKQRKLVGELIRVVRDYI